MAEALIPRIRGDLRRTRRVQDGKVSWIIKDPTGGKYFQFGEAEMWLIDRFDGTRSFVTISAELKSETGMRAPPATIQSFYLKLKQLGLAERSVAEKSVMLMERLRRDRKERLKATDNTIFRMRFSLGDPDQLFTRMVPPLRFFWTREFIILSAFLFAAYVWLLADNWTLFMVGFRSLYDPATYTAGFIVTLYITGVAIFMVHEFGHGLTCKRFGGEVHEMGAMLLYFSPAFYCNVSDAYTFEKRAHRFWVTFAGGWIQLVIAAIAAVVWAFSEPATTVHNVAFIATLLAGGMSLLFNYNPLLPLDGYYALVDWVGIINLRARSMELVGAEAKRRILRMKMAVPAVTAREYRIMLAYGILALLYTIFVLWVISHWAGSLAVRKLGGWGWALIAFFAWRITRRLRPRAARLIRGWISEHLPDGPRRRVVVRSAAVLATLLILSLIVPWTVRVRGPAVVETTARTWLRPPETAWVAEVLVREGDSVQTGQELVRLRNPELELETARARARVAALERERTRFAAGSNAGAERIAQLQLQAARSELHALAQRAASLAMRAPFAGTIVTPHLNELVGARAEPGDSLVELWAAGPMRVRIALAQRDAGEVGIGDRVRLRFPADAGAVWGTRVSQVGAAAHAERVELLAPVGSESEGSLVLRPGMAGQARIAVDRTSIAGAALRGVRRLIRTERFL